MLRLRRLLTLLTILGLALGSMVSAARLGVTAPLDVAAPASGALAAMLQDGRAGCEDCASGRNGPTTGFAAAGCHGSLCLGQAGVLPDSPAIPLAAPARFLLATASMPDGLSHPPGSRPPKAAGPLTPAGPEFCTAPA
ncbi:hypothetical protein [Azospirillum agricola]|uniref:hypothetical protein n=1 Tax=Azospirillum agricola TaxID=1720247 RepID=UPI000A0F28C7|nr:hypothetical protein [Azospirillum agricola]SMH61457.1 hypothetical protein SAMN02982994_5848 [Azospirillum lipoferum]